MAVTGDKVDGTVVMKKLVEKLSIGGSRGVVVARASKRAAQQKTISSGGGVSSEQIRGPLRVV